MLKRLLRMLIVASVFGVTFGCEELRFSSSVYPAESVFHIGTTYDWVANAGRSDNDPRSRDPYVHEAIRSTIEREMAARSFEQIYVGMPDFEIDYYVAPELGRDQYTTALTDYDAGALTIYIVNPQTRKAVWRGTATARLNDDDSMEKRQHRIERAIRGILDRFPP